MEIVDLSHNDDLLAVIRKCNTNFKQLAFSASQNLKAQGRSSGSSAEAMVADAINEITNVTVPAEVSAQIASQDIPQMVSDAVAAIAIVPPVGSYLMSQTNPSGTYTGTTWQQVDTISTDSSTIIPLYQRTA
jgi:hypothetical protein